MINNYQCRYDVFFVKSYKLYLVAIHEVLIERKMNCVSLVCDAVMIFFHKCLNIISLLVSYINLTWMLNYIGLSCVIQYVFFLL